MNNNTRTMESQELKPQLGLLSAMSIVVGVVLGAGAFMKPPAVLAAAGDSNLALAAWILGGMFSAAGGLTLCELGAMFPRTGGVYVYLEEVFGEKTAFLYGWMITFLFGPATVGALAGYFSSVFCLIFDIPNNYVAVVSAGVLAFVTFVNSISVTAAGRVQMVATACKLIPIVLLVVFGLWKGNGQVLGMSAGTAGAAAPVFSVAVLATLFAYDGWAQVAALGGEIKNPAKILPRAIIGGLTFLVIVYVAINVALLKVLPADQMVALGHDASTIAAQKLFGLTGGNMISVGIMIAMIGGLNGYIMTLSRVLYSMGVRGQMPGSRLWGKLDSDSNTPVCSIVFLVSISFVYNLLFDADRLSNIASFSNWIFYMLTFVAVFIARRRFADVPRPYRVPLYPLTPIVAICGALYVFYGMVSTEPLNALFSIGLTLAGLPVFWYMAGQQDGRRRLPRVKTRYVVAVCSLTLLAMMTMSIRVFDLRPEIRVATEPSLVPFSYQEQGTLQGFDVELMNVAANRAGFKVVYLPVSFENLFDALEKGYADVAIASLSVTTARQEKVLFSQPYINDGGLGLLVRSGSAVKSPADLAGKNVGVHKGSTGEQYARQLNGLKLQPFQSDADMAMAFNQGSVDAVIHDRLILGYLLNRQVFQNGQFAGELQREDYAIAVSKNHKDIGEKLNKALEDLQKNGELTALKAKWFTGAP
ncbi:MAG TPA: amino acid permease [Patescibacteria group bacterium]|nr:amino acid permease [Patescibacteria group bacterium]